jgi:hypothetical protein
MEYRIHYARSRHGRFKAEEINESNSQFAAGRPEASMRRLPPYVGNKHTHSELAVSSEPDHRLSYSALLYGAIDNDRHSDDLHNHIVSATHEPLRQPLFF